GRVGTKRQIHPGYRVADLTNFRSDADDFHRHRRHRGVGFSQVGPLGRWQAKLDVTADRAPGAEVYLGESLVDDRRLVPGSAVEFGERLAEDETADDRLKV